MTITYTPTDLLERPDYPFFAYCSNTKQIKIILVMELGTSVDRYAGYLVNPGINADGIETRYKPFEYYSQDWHIADFKPFRGEIRIDTMLG